MAAKLRTFLCTPNKTLLALPPVAGTLTRGLTHFVRIIAHVLAPQSLVLGALMDIIEMEFQDRLPFGFSLLCKVENELVGKAHVSIKGNDGVLSDIIVIERTHYNYSFFSSKKTIVSHRNKGYGTLLLKSVIAHCKRIGLNKLTGKIVGETNRLEQWYFKNGFSVVNGQIIKVLS